MVSYPTESRKISRVAATDLSNAQYKAVILNSSGKIEVSGANGFAIGFLMTGVPEGRVCEVAILGGGAKGIAAGTIPAGTFVRSDANGELVATTSDPADIPIAKTLDSAVAGDIISVLPFLSHQEKSGGGGSLTDTQIAFGNASNEITSDPDLTWDNSGKILDINGNLAMGGALDASSILDLQSTTKGFLPPRMTTIERNAISSPAEGLVVYDTDLNAEFFYNGSSWINPLVSSDIGVTVQGYDAGTLVSSDIGVTVQGYDADTAKTDVVQTYSAVQIFNQNIRANRAILQVVSTSKILSLGDANMEMEMNSASPQTLTVPPNSSVAFLEGTEIEVIQIGAGSVAIVAGAGVTINTKSSLVLNGQYASAILKKRAVNTWTLTGDTI